MSDLISRQLAIDAICSECSGRCIPCESYPCGEIKVLMRLQSAEPEIIRCKDCKYWLDIDDGRQKHRMCADVYGDWFCADAERRNDDKTNKGSSC